MTARASRSAPALKRRRRRLKSEGRGWQDQVAGYTQIPMPPRRRGRNPRGATMSRTRLAYGSHRIALLASCAFAAGAVALSSAPAMAGCNSGNVANSILANAVANTDAATLGQVKAIATSAAIEAVADETIAKAVAATTFAKTDDMARELAELRAAVKALQQKVSELETRNAVAQIQQ